MKMKLYTLFIMFTAVATLGGCNNDDDNNAQNPIDQLPPPTQTGANTFGALLDGEVFLPGQSSNPLDCQYQLISGERYFQLQARNRNENFNLISLSLYDC